MVTATSATVDTAHGAWRRLAQHDSAPFTRPGWVMAWAEQAAVIVDAVTASRDGRIVALLPVVRERGGLVTPADWHTPWIGAAYQDDAALAALAAEVMAERPSRVILDFVDRDGKTASVFSRALADSGYSIRVRHRLDSPYVLLTEDAWRPSSKRRRELRRRRLLEEIGDVTFEVHDGSGPIEGLLDERFAIEHSGWKSDTAISRDASVEGFYRRVASWAADEGLLRLGSMRLAGKAIAFDLALEDARAHYLLKTGYVTELRRFGPGMLLRNEMIDIAARAGLERYEFTGDAEQWKMDWADRVRHIVEIDAAAPGAGGTFARVRRLAERARRRLNRWGITWSRR